MIDHPTVDHPTERFDVLLLVVQRWRLVGAFLLVGLAIGFGYARTAKPTVWFEASIAVVPSQRASESGAQLAGAGLVADALASDVQRIKSVLTSNSVGDAVIEKFGLDAHYHTTDRQDTRAILRQRCTVSVDRKSELVALSCKDESAALAAKLADYFGEEGNRVFERISTSSAREERAFLAAQVERTRRDVADVSERLRDFQRAHKIVDLTEQSRAVISAMGAIQGEMLSKQLELSYQAGFAAADESSVLQLKRQIHALKHKLERLETGTTSRGVTAPAVAGTRAEFFPPAMDVPDLRFELEALVREQRAQETLYLALMQRFEMAKVNEARDTSTFQFLDHATVPTRPVGPGQMRVVMLAGIVGLALALAWIIVPVWWRCRVEGSHAR